MIQYKRVSEKTDSAKKTPELLFDTFLVYAYVNNYLQ